MNFVLSRVCQEKANESHCSLCSECNVVLPTPRRPLEWERAVAVLGIFALEIMLGHGWESYFQGCRSIKYVFSCVRGETCISWVSTCSNVWAISQLSFPLQVLKLYHWLKYQESLKTSKFYKRLTSFKKKEGKEMKWLLNEETLNGHDDSDLC